MVTHIFQEQPKEHFLHNSFLVCPIRLVSSWSHASKTTINKILETVFEGRSKNTGKKEKKRRKNYCKAFYVTSKRKNERQL